MTSKREGTRTKKQRADWDRRERRYADFLLKVKEMASESLAL